MNTTVQRQSPYVGLMPFEPQDAEYFFGREEDTEILRMNVMGAATTLVYGPSGVGKSSVVNAGLLPKLKARDDVISVVHREWNSKPVPAIQEGLAESTAQKLGEFHIRSEESLDESLRRAAVSLAKSIKNPDELIQRPGRVIIILDQFEEYIINHKVNEETVRELTQAFRRPHPSVAVLISIREDWLARLDRFIGIFPTLQDNSIRIDPLSSNGAISAIQRPLEQYSEQFPDSHAPKRAEDELVDALVEQVKRTDNLSTPVLSSFSNDAEDFVDTAFLQVVLTRLWHDERLAKSDTLRLETLNSLGNSSRILDDHLASVFDRLKPSQQEHAVEMFDRLVTPSETKIAQSADDLAAYLKVPTAELEEILDVLAGPDSRVLRSFSPRDRPDSKRYELYHDLLAKSVRSWLVGRRVEAQVREDLANRRMAAEAEVARKILVELLDQPSRTDELSKKLSFPEPTIAEIVKSLNRAGIVTTVTSDDPKWVFRPGRGFRESVIKEPRDTLLSTKKSHRIKVQLIVLAVVACTFAGLVVFSHPIGLFGDSVLGQLVDATLVLSSCAILGGTLSNLQTWLSRSSKGLASSKGRTELVRNFWRGSGMGVFAIVIFFYPIAYISGNGAWLRGQSTLWLAAIVALLGYTYTRLGTEMFDTDRRRHAANHGA